ncbi:LysE family translocator [Planctomonas sp. JC2975]|uniref:LysE family translocator n=1 Tax=Planctomonas sp. JC2975 TaxID=2729626 RepID=UPI001474C7A9|nr:LysE family translocator [Planctomonas sp. JC2975]NNC12524.1 LysE family translocator [Planctomonas sp. JC2975]
MNPTAVLAFAGVALSLIVVPGPDWAYVLGVGARDRVVLPAVGGLVVGYALLTGIVAAGVGPLVAALPGFLLGLTLVGAAYLVYLGVMTLRHPSAVEVSNSAAIGSPRWRLVGKGIGVSALNPKGLLVFLAILPQFARENATWPMTAQLALLGAVFVALCCAFYLSLGFAARRILGARPATARIISRVSGAAMILVGFALVAERVVQLVESHTG